MEVVAKFKSLKLKKHLDTCKTTCKKSYNALSSSERKHVDQLMVAVVAFYAKMVPLLPQAASFVKTMNVDSVIALLKTINRILQKDETVALIEHYIAMYGETAKDPKRLKAYGAYLRCVLHHLAPQYKRVAIVAIDLAFTILHLVVRKEIKGYIKELGTAVHKNIVKPIHRDLRA